jgi:hypothetical protein
MMAWIPMNTLAPAFVNYHTIKETLRFYTLIALERTYLRNCQQAAGAGCFFMEYESEACKPRAIIYLYFLEFLGRCISSIFSNHLVYQSKHTLG